jgi:predicted GH43/DUF377 family glycosyl hydrolase
MAQAPGSRPEAPVAVQRSRPSVLQPDLLDSYVAQFNATDEELYRSDIDNASAGPFLRSNVPLFDCPDKQLQETYYFRWWTYRKHIKQTADGFVVSEFVPAVRWAGKYNTISCAAGHHFYEGRWLADPRYLDNYAGFWFRKGGEPRRYSFWAADALWNRYLVSGDKHLLVELLPDLEVNYEAWEETHRDSNGLFWQKDDRDGMEVSIGGSGYRATINSYMYGDAMAIARIAELAGQQQTAERYCQKAATIKRLVEEKLWDPQAGVFKVAARGEPLRLADVRELHGYTPWYFHLPDPAMAVAWKQVIDAEGFYAPYGLTTAERRHPKFALSYEGHECQWNGPSWPYSTTVTLTAMANLLNDGSQEVVSRHDYFKLLTIYAHSQRLKRPDGQVVPWIDEDLNPLTGDWIARSRLKSWKNGTWDASKGGVERGKDYNHSTFCDLVINGLVGLRPRADDTIEINPLLPEGSWDYFCLDQIFYHGHSLTILYDKSGDRYHQGAGLRLSVDGQQTGHADRLSPLTASLGPALASADPPATETTAGWNKYEHNPVLGGALGTCFDISVLKEGDAFRMWFSWRPKKSIALVESRDGFHWSEPVIALGPNASTGWEENINRPIVIKRGQTYHMWYTGQAKGHSAIGYATSRDEKTWKRRSDKPVLAPEAAWEKVAVMCPHVLWDDRTQQYRMWYSGGGQYEPDAVGYATSADGVRWTKLADNPILRPDPSQPWEQHLVTACQVVQHGDWHLMFYIGFRDINHAQIGLARSKDGITGWQRHPANPIIRPGIGQWDQDACYKPFAIFSDGKWLLWYNGRREKVEQIGAAIHEGEELGF